ncbi:hypothetical protein KSP39_PZI011439 [Platanthera zijinensis]|uniref:DDE Tnp4 domain-containing protein n=1 Tax=Platanthera zijinensis TaxID=2320716 RepID=A0AAP0B9F9_9ASPA
MPFFKDCIGAIDGTHVDARVPAEQQVAYIGRHGTTTQNVMAVCDFNMCFTFVLAGWEGSTHDSRIFQRALMDPSYNFPYPPHGKPFISREALVQEIFKITMFLVTIIHTYCAISNFAGKYYVVDAGYPLQRGFLKPYSGTRYHLPDFRRGSRPIQGRREIFNQAHSSLRSVIERSFGVWKKKWKILRDMPPYSLTKQRDIVIATMSLHNYIRRHPSRSDTHFRACDEDEHFIYPAGIQRRTGQSNENSGGDHVIGIRVGVDEMVALRDSIADQLHRA